MERFIEAVILALIFEGITVALFPGHTRKALLEAAGMSDQGIRSLGGAALAFALILAFILRIYA